MKTVPHFFFAASTAGGLGAVLVPVMVGLVAKASVLGALRAAAGWAGVTRMAAAGLTLANAAVVLVWALAATLVGTGAGAPFG